MGVSSGASQDWALLLRRYRGRDHALEGEVAMGSLRDALRKSCGVVLIRTARQPSTCPQEK